MKLTLVLGLLTFIVLSACKETEVSKDVQNEHVLGCKYADAVYSEGATLRVKSVEIDPITKEAILKDDPNGPLMLCVKRKGFEWTRADK